jgi:protein-glutamine gamma-glutamyltransferase
MSQIFRPSYDDTGSPASGVIKMIRIGGQTIREESMSDRYSDDNIKRMILLRMFSSESAYDFASIKALEFEIEVRAAIVRAAEKLNDSYFSFAVFKRSKCNTDFWNRTEEGGFKIKPGVSPYLGIKDILQHSRLYATECATAIVIVFYLGLAEILPEELFNELFSDLYLMDWKYLDKDLGVRTYRNIKDSLPGDCLYFANPDFNPDTPEWQGENVIRLIDGKYYGHGIGIRTAEGIIRALNRTRKPDATESAFLTDTVVKPNYKYLFERYASAQRALAMRNHS